MSDVKDWNGAHGFYQSVASEHCAKEGTDVPAFANKFPDVPQPIVSLVAHTEYPIETLYATEKFAKTNNYIKLLHDPKTIAEVRQLRYQREIAKDYEGNAFAQGDIEILERSDDFQALGFKNIEEYVDEIETWAKKVVSMAIPIAEFITFTFQIEDVSIAFREQLVRHRQNSYWIQSGRITDYSTFAIQHSYNVPDAIKEAGLESEWRKMFYQQQELFKLALAKGVNEEDAREIIGNGVYHRLSMSINLRSLIELLKHRTCFITQGHWAPIVMGIIEELKKIDPVFEFLGLPPCMDSKRQFTNCKYIGMMEERVEGKDPLPVCPLFAGKKKIDIQTVIDAHGAKKWNKERNKQFGKLWSITKTADFGLEEE